MVKVKKVTPEVTYFFRNLEFSDYFIKKIYDFAGEAAISLTEDDPYWLLSEFEGLGFLRVDEAAKKLGISPEDPRRIEAGISYALASYVAEGHCFAPISEFCEKTAAFLDVSERLVNDIIEDMTFSGKLQPTMVNDTRVLYFYSFYRAECRLAGNITALAERGISSVKQLKPVCADPDSFIRKYEAEKGISLSAKQISAVKNALIFGVSIITGGPGTGKTTIINAIIYIMEMSGFKVAVCAPTGRAAKRIMEAGGHPAQTVHRLLEYYYDEVTDSMSFGKNENNPLQYDCIVVDESSMLDIMLCEALIRAIKPGTRLIIAGDSDQLPSVGAGNVLSDLIESEYFNVEMLTEIFRQQDASRIVVNAHRINQGDYPVYDEDFELIELEKQVEIRERIAEICKDKNLSDVQVLTPVKKGILGSASLNERLQEVFNPQEKGKPELKFGKRIFRLGDRVMHLKNDYQLEVRRLRTDDETGYEPEVTRGVFNGETGIICAIDAENKTVTVVYDEDRFVEYEHTLLDEIDLAYAITVHKSQGSEYPTVIIPMSWFPPMLATRSLIYTAVTRGKNRVIIVGKSEYMNQMVDNDTSRKRYSGLCERIQSLF